MATMCDFDERTTPRQTSHDGDTSSYDMPRATEMRGSISFQSDRMPPSHATALCQLIHLQCNRLEKQLIELKMKRQLLLQGEAVTVSLDELVVGGSLEAPESLLNPLLAYTQEDSSGYGSVDYVRSQTIGKEISQIIDSINVRNSAEEADGFPRRVQFTALEVDDDAFTRGPRRCATLPERRENLPISNDVQLLLHMQGSCKPCAFYYNKRKGCRNGTSCGFCHHVDHSVCSLKQWKKQQKLYSQSGSMSYDLIGDMFVPSGSPQ